MKIKFRHFVMCGCLLTSGMFSAAVAQKDQPELMGSFSKGDFGEFQYHMAQKFLDYPDKASLVVRICSIRPLRDALATAAGISTGSAVPNELSKFFRVYGIFPERISYATYSGCSSIKDAFSKVEYWSVAPSAELPSDELSALSDVNITSIPYRPSGQAKGTLVSVLREEPRGNRFVYVIGGYLKKPSKVLRRNVKAAEQDLMIIDKNLKVRSYFLTLDRIPDADEKETTYPILVVVDIK